MRASTLLLTFVFAIGGLGCACDDTGDGQGNDDVVAPTLGSDADNDGYVDALDGGDDCDDGDATVHPGAPEDCDGVDDDCDGWIDEDADGIEGALCAEDGDGDGDDEDDCDDTDAAIHPGAEELCNGVDDNCDGLIDEDAAGHEGALCPPEDGDGDGWDGDEDCDDTDAAVFPGAEELCNGIDDDCDGSVDEGFDGDGDGIPDCEDGDGDGYSADDGDCDDGDAAIHPGAIEPCNGIDDDCDGEIDEDTDVDGDGIPDCSDDCPVYVDLAVADPGYQDGTWTWPFESIQDGMDEAAADGCRFVDVYPGTYVETIDFQGWDLEVVAVGGRAATTIDGDGMGTVVTASSQEPATALLEGFTITGGTGTLGGGINVAGAGVGQTSDLRIVDNHIVDNVATQCGQGCGFGGGIRLLHSNALVEGNLIEGNDADFGGPEDGSDGGGIAVVFGAPMIADNIIVDNSAGDGGGIWLAKSDATVVNNVVSGNVADDQGGAHDHDEGQGGGINVQVGSAGLLVANNLVTDNEASAIGGGICVYEYNAGFGNGQIANNTIAWNRIGAGGYGAGLAVWINTAPDVRNNVIAFNAGAGVYTHATALANSYGTAVTYAYNGVHGNSPNWAAAVTAAAGSNANVDPAFVSAPDGDWTNDFHLAGGSAARDAGDPAAAWNDPDGRRNDLGCYGGPDGGW